LADWAENFAGRIAGKAGLWDIPAEEANALQTAFTDFKSLHEMAASPQKTPIIVARKNAAKVDLLKKIRAMVGYRLQNPIITAVDRTELGLHIRDTNPTTIPPPVSRPEF
jgi:hypothetical protein